MLRECKRNSSLSLIVIVITILILAVAFAARAETKGTGERSHTSAGMSAPSSKDRILDSYGKLPLSFVANQGHVDARVKFMSRTGSYTLFLTGDEAVLVFTGSKEKKSPEMANLRPLAGVNGIAQAIAFPRIASMAEPPTGRTSESPSARADTHVLRMKLHNANTAATVRGLDELVGKSNYFIGKDPARWRTNVLTYGKVKYEGIYPGIDLVYYGNQRQLEYDFIVAPGADPRRIAFDLQGARRVRLDEHGDLVLKTREGEMRWHKPVAYQENGGRRQDIAAHYLLADANCVGFEIAGYDKNRPLFIDPLIYSTYLGGSLGDQAYGIAVDIAGNAYITGQTNSIDFPTNDPLQLTRTTGPNPYSYDVFVAKINSKGSALIYSTYLGGSDDDGGTGIAVDEAGDAYVTGFTRSTDFPVTNGAFQTTCLGLGFCRTAFVSKISSSGSELAYSTRLGGSDLEEGRGIAVDASGNAYVTGFTYSADFPLLSPLQSSYSGGGDTFVSKIEPSGSALIYSTYLGGSDRDWAHGIAVDSSGYAYVAGVTYSTDFPTMNPLQAHLRGGYFDAFVSKINPSGSALVYSTYLGGSSSDEAMGVAADALGNAYVTGYTFSSDFPVTIGSFQTTYGSSFGTAFVSKINPLGSAFVYSTYLGGSGNGGGSAIAVDNMGSAHVAGVTLSSDFPITPGAFQTKCHGCPYWEAFVTKLNSSGSGLLYSTFLGGSSYDEAKGIAVHPSGNIYVTGSTFSSDFPRKAALQPASASPGPSWSDAFVTKIDMRRPPTITLSSSLNPSVYGQKVTWTAKVTSTGLVAPTGKVAFNSSVFDRSFTIGSAVVDANGIATLTRSNVNAGYTYPITATYLGDDWNGSSTSPVLNQVIEQATSMASIASSANPSSPGQAVTFTALITSPTVTPTGPVTFTAGMQVLGTAQIVPWAHRATLTISALPVGSTKITVTYYGNSNVAKSSASLTQTVQ